MMKAYYENDRIVNEYLAFHYGTPDDVLPYPFGPGDALGFPVRCVRECLSLEALPRRRVRGLELGCAAGRSVFELARFCDEVVGIDGSPVLIRCAEVMRETGRVGFHYVEEGELIREAEAVVPPDVDRKRVRFEQGNAECLRADLGGFDVILMANLIDRLADPERCLTRLPSLANPGCQLVITSPYTWLEAFTPRQNWLGGVHEQGRGRRTIDGLKQRLANAFELMGVKDLPFLMREHSRKFQWSVAQASMWRRR